jgi:Trypsin-co-occurring domain 1
MSENTPPPVYVPVVEMTDGGREIGWNSNVSEMLTARLDDIRDAIRAGAASISTSLSDVPVVADWQVNQVEASFGITLAAEAGVILSKGSAEATFEVNITFARSEPARER